VPKLDEVERGLAPQLPLEAAIAERGGFEGVAPAPVAGLEYWRLSGGRVAGEICERAGDPARVKALADAALAGLAALVACFADPRTPYGAIVRPRPGPLYGEYLHLARVKEWLPAVETGE
jgi:ATP-dependent helicase/nuclease subunit B